jgi:AcrR family transcriptional regulator
MTEDTATRATWQRPMRADARRNCERLLTAAERAFGEHGTAASLEEIARTAGVGIGTLYRHFPTREVLIQAVLADRLDSLCEQGRQLLNDPCPTTALHTWVRAYVSAANTFRGLAGAMVEAAAGFWANPGPTCRRLIEAGGGLLARAQAHGSARTDLDPRDLFTLLNSVAIAVGQLPKEDDARADRVLAVIATGLAAPLTGPAAS